MKPILVFPLNVALAGALASVLACTVRTQSGPATGSAGSTSVEDFCAVQCDRLNGCDASKDVSTCVNSCKNANAGSLPKYRNDVVSMVEGCVGKKDCRTVLSSSFVTTCVSEAVASISPSEAAASFCSELEAAQTKCGRTVEHAACLDVVAPFGDATIAEAAACASKACSAITDCLTAALGGSSGSSSGGSSSGGSGSSGTGDASGACTLSISSGSATCNACLERSCCAPDNACGRNSDCVAVMKCLGNCSSSDSACASACVSAHATGASLLQSFVTCESSSCSAACGQ
jgi:hypothetical protein